MQVGGCREQHPTTRGVLRDGSRVEVLAGQKLPPHPALPGLEPVVDELFRQIAG